MRPPRPHSKSSSSEVIMSDLVCIICHKDAALNKSLISNTEMIEHLYESCKERLSLVQNNTKSLTDRLASLSEVERKSTHTTTVSAANQSLIGA